ncbi:MAG: SusC/RagA family TonB-linked outer membrane protein [Gemmatimonadetes bacterium]|nr:SusC/RagA family TonB-linked outer membrane protein [Gemmatimonadota bacterium]
MAADPARSRTGRAPRCLTCSRSRTGATTRPRSGAMARKGGSSFPGAVPAAAQAALLGFGLALCSAFALPLSGQQTGSISGTVQDEVTGQPILAVQLFVPNTNLNAVTSAAGAFRLDNVPAGPVDLHLVRLGYSPIDLSVQVTGGQVVTVSVDLASSAVSLDALVVTATGVQRRREIGNSVTTLQVSRELERVMPTTVIGLLQGRAPGVTVLQSSGSVGTSSSIKVRGNTSINLSNTPLVYIDGVRVSNAVQSGLSVGGQNTSRLNDLSPYEIESIEVVKGPSAATLYGTEASAGVLRITTKRGRPGASEWTFFSETGSSWDDTRWPDNVFNPRAFFGTIAADTLYRMNLLEKVGTDTSPWRTGREQTFGGSLQGGVEQVTYFLSGSWDEREGTLPNNQSTRRNLRANFAIAPSPNVDVQVSTSLGSHEATLPDNDNNGYGYLGVAMVAFPWQLPIRRDDPVTGAQDVRTCPLDYEYSRLSGFPLGNQGCQDNPFYLERTFEDVATLDNRQKIERFTGSTTLAYRPFRFLSGRGTVGYDQYSDRTGSFIPVDPDLPFGEDSRGARDIGNSVVAHLTLQGDVAATFDLRPGLRSTTAVGVQFYRQKAESASASGTFLPPGSKLVSSAVRTEGGEGVGEARNLGIYMEQQFAWRDRLFVTPALRMDDNAAFGANLGRKSYPKLMASWVVSEEDWFQDLVPGSFVESLRLRGAWGESGKHPSSTAALTILGSQRVTFRGRDEAGITICCPGNPDLRPETGKEMELGFEADLFDGRFGLDFTWFKKVAVDAIVSRELAPSTGYPSAVATNIGEIENGGIELSLSAVAMSRPQLYWDWQLNLATVKGKVTKLDEPIIYGANGNSQRHQEGYAYGAYFSRDYFIDDDGEVASTEEPVYIGQPTPEWEGSLSTSVRLLDWITLYANLGFAGGYQQFNSTEEFRCGFLGGGKYGGICPQIFEKDAEGERTDLARLKSAAAQDVQYAPWIEDADFARLRSVSARFDIPAGWVRRIGGTRGSFMLQAENLALWTGYTGVDPEVSSEGASQSLRLDFLTVPPAKRLTGRFEVTF